MKGVSVVTLKYMLLNKRGVFFPGGMTASCDYIETKHTRLSISTVTEFESRVNELD